MVSNMTTNGIVGSQPVVKQSSQTIDMPRRKSTRSIPVSHQKSESTWAWTLAKVALVAAAVLGVGVAINYTKSSSVPTDFSQLDYSQQKELTVDLAKMCNTAVRNWCKTFPNQEYHCVAEYLDPNWQPDVSLEYGRDILCPVYFKPEYAKLIGRGANMFAKNHEDISALIPEGFRYPEALQYHQKTWDSPENSVTFKSHFFVAGPAKISSKDIPLPVLSPLLRHFDAKNHSLHTTPANISSDDIQFPIQQDEIGFCPLT